MRGVVVGDTHARWRAARHAETTREAFQGGVRGDGGGIERVHALRGAKRGDGVGDGSSQKAGRVQRGTVRHQTPSTESAVGGFQANQAAICGGEANASAGVGTDGGDGGAGGHRRRGTAGAAAGDARAQVVRERSGRVAKPVG